MWSLLRGCCCCNCSVFAATCKQTNNEEELLLLRAYVRMCVGVVDFNHARFRVAEKALFYTLITRCFRCKFPLHYSLC